jgi:hypothetical protein
VVVTGQTHKYLQAHQGAQVGQVAGHLFLAVLAIAVEQERLDKVLAEVNPAQAANITAGVVVVVHLAVLDHQVLAQLTAVTVFAQASVTQPNILVVAAQVQDLVLAALAAEVLCLMLITFLLVLEVQ